MRKWFASLGAVALVTAAASAQSIPNFGAYPEMGYDNGNPSVGWKVAFPTGAGDRFNVDFNADLAGQTVVGMALDLWSTGAGGALGQVAFCTSNFGVDGTGTTPDTVAGVISGTVGPTGIVPASSAGFCPGFAGVDLTDFAAGTDTHAVMTMVTGDTTLWLCSDTGAAVGRSYFTTNNYATTALPFSVNWMMRAVVMGAPGTFTINAQTVANVGQDDSLSFEFWGTAGTTGYLQGLIGPPFGWLSLPGFILPTGVYNFATPGIGANNGGISGSLAGICPPVGLSLGFAAFWLDKTSPKANGHPKAKLTPTATLNVVKACIGCCPILCYGWHDDGILDGTIWKVGYPSGGGDWFSVNNGAVPAGVNNLLSLSAACWDFNGTGGTFKSAGAYKANYGVDPSGNTLDPASPISSVGGVSASVAPGAAQWAYPSSTLFDFPNVAATVGSVVHSGINFNTGDTGLWLASDTDGTDDDSCQPCGVIPNTTSAFSSNNFATTSIPFTFANAMEKLNWN